MSLLTLQNQVNDLQDQVDALLAIGALPVRVSADGTEFVAVDVAGVEYKMNPATFFANRHTEKTDDFDLALVDSNSTIKLEANSKTCTIPVDLAWNNGSVCWIVVYGTGFTIDHSAVTANIPVALDGTNKALYRIQKTAANVFSIIQIGLPGDGVGDMLASTYDPTAVVGDAFDMDQMAEGTAKILTAAERTKLSGVETGATGDQSDAEIRAAVEAATDSNVFTDADHTKLNGIAAGAEVNDTVTETADTGTELTLDKILGRLSNMASANATTTYTFTGSTAGAWEKVLINAASEPVVTGATNIAGSTFAISIDMYLVLWHNGNRAEFWFEET